MTDKIIIDGIDVSECEYALTPKKQCPNKSMPYAKETSCIACKEQITKHNFCKNNPNCYYKQLKRKEQECEELEKQLYNCNVIIDRFLMACRKSKDITQPEEFEEVFEDIEQTYSECEELKKIIAEIKESEIELENIKNSLFVDYMRYKQALDEIEKEVIELFIGAENKDRPYCERILNIINKAKE